MLLTELGPLLARLGRGRGAGAYARAWGAASGVTHYLPIPLLLAALAWLIAGPTA